MIVVGVKQPTQGKIILGEISTCVAELVCQCELPSEI